MCWALGSFCAVEGVGCGVRGAPLQLETLESITSIRIRALTLEAETQMPFNHQKTNHLSSTVTWTRTSKNLAGCLPANERQL